MLHANTELVAVEFFRTNFSTKILVENLTALRPGSARVDGRTVAQRIVVSDTNNVSVELEAVIVYEGVGLASHVLVANQP